MAVTVIETTAQWDEAFAEGHAAVLIHSDTCGPCNGFVPVWIALAPHFIKKRSNWALYSSLTTHATELMTDLDIMGVPQVILILCPHSTRLPSDMMKECRLVERRGISRLVYVTKRWPNADYATRLTPWLLPTCGASCCFASVVQQRRALLNAELPNASALAEEPLPVSETCSAKLKAVDPNALPRKILRHNAPSAQPRVLETRPILPSPGHADTGPAPRIQARPTSAPDQDSSWLGNPVSFASPVSKESLNIITSTLEAFRDPVGYWTRRISRTQPHTVSSNSSGH